MGGLGALVVSCNLCTMAQLTGMQRISIDAMLGYLLGSTQVPEFSDLDRVKSFQAVHGFIERPITGIPPFSTRNHAGIALCGSSSSLLFGGRASGALRAQLSISRTRKAFKALSTVIKCDQSSEEGGKNSLDTWLGRIAMLGFVGTVAVETISGKGLLQAAGITAPAPTLALALTALVGVVTAIGIFRSASKD